MDNSWKSMPESTGYYWLDNTSNNTVDCVWFFSYDKTLAKVGEKVVVPIKELLDRYPESKFKYIGTTPFSSFQGSDPLRGKENDPWSRIHNLLYPPPEKHITPKVGVGVFVVDVEKRSFLLMHRINKDGHGDGQWSLPGGHIEHMESPFSACKREIEEETGLVIDHLTPYAVPYTNDYFPETNKHYITLFFAAIAVGGNLENREPHKCKELKWLDVQAANDKNSIPSPLFSPLDKLIPTPVASLFLYNMYYQVLNDKFSNFQIPVHVLPIGLE